MGLLPPGHQAAGFPRLSPGRHQKIIEEGPVLGTKDGVLGPGSGSSGIVSWCLTFPLARFYS